MPLRVLRASILVKFLVPSVLVLACVVAPVAQAQHAGGRPGGGGVRVYIPPLSRPPISHPPVSRPFSAAPPVGVFRPGGSLLFRPGPFRPRPYPIYGYPFFGPQAQFWWFWAVWSYNSCAWANCYFWNWSPSYDRPFYQYVPTPVYPSALYFYSYAQSRELPQLFLKDGTVYSVTDYWLADNQVHFKVFDERAGKPVEQVIPLDDLDLQTTIEVNTRRGFRFVLRDEPMEQYLQHHPNQPPPDWTTPKQ